MKLVVGMLITSMWLFAGCTDEPADPPHVNSSDDGTDSGDDTGEDTADDSGGDSDTGSGSTDDSDSGPAGPCYDVETADGLGCYGKAQAGDCAPAYEACGTGTGCADLETCLNTDCNGLQGDAWTDCDETCRAANPDGVALWDAFQSCIYCDVCAVECAADAVSKGCEMTGSCDELKTECYGEEADGSPACWGCAMATTCKEQVEACEDSPDCQTLEACTNVCNEGDPADWETCVNNCRTLTPGGIALLSAYHACVYCEACPTLCVADAGDKCD